MRSSFRKRTRLAGVGFIARAGTNVLALACVVGLISSLSSGKADVGLGIAFAAVAVPVAVRSWALSVRFTPQELVATTWLRTVRVPLGSISSCQSVPYGGFFSKGTTTFLLWELEISTTDHRVYRLGGTAATKRKSKRQEAELRRAISSARERSEQRPPCPNEKGSPDEFIGR